MNSHYDTLGVRPDAPEVVIRAAYKALSMQHHPDRGGNAELMASINAAYDVLSDPASRSQYDESLKPKSRSIQNKTKRKTDFIDYVIDSRPWYVQISFITIIFCGIPLNNGSLNEPLNTIVGTAMLVAGCIFLFDLVSEYRKSKKN